MSRCSYRKWVLPSAGVLVLLSAAIATCLRARFLPGPHLVHQAPTVPSRQTPTVLSSHRTTFDIVDEQKRLDIKWATQRLGEGDLESRRPPRIKPGAPPPVR